MAASTPKERTLYFMGVAYYRATLIFGALYLLLAAGWIGTYMTTEEQSYLSIRLIGWIFLPASVFMIIQGLRGIRDDRIHSYSVIPTGSGGIFVLCVYILIAIARGVLQAIDGDLGYQDALITFSMVLIGTHPLAIAFMARTASAECQESTGPASSRDSDQI